MSSLHGETPDAVRRPCDQNEVKDPIPVMPGPAFRSWRQSQPCPTSLGCPSFRNNSRAIVVYTETWVNVIGAGAEQRSHQTALCPTNPIRSGQSENTHSAVPAEARGGSVGLPNRGLQCRGPFAAQLKVHLNRPAVHGRKDFTPAMGGTLRGLSFSKISGPRHPMAGRCLFRP
jgi:hypothetical protein